MQRIEAAWPSGKAKVCKTFYLRFDSGCRLHFFFLKPFLRASGGMAYTADLKSAALTGLRVRIPPRLPIITQNLPLSIREHSSFQPSNEV